MSEREGEMREGMGVGCGGSNESYCMRTTVRECDAT